MAEYYLLMVHRENAEIVAFMGKISRRKVEVREHLLVLIPFGKYYLI